MAFAFPVSLEVAGRHCVVFGTSAVARARAEALLDAGAVVTVIARSESGTCAPVASAAARADR